MKIPLKWLKEYVDIPQSQQVFTDKMSMIGHMLDKIEETDNDIVVDLELRGNRADCFSVIGIARETHACFGGRFEIPKVTPLTLVPFKDFNIRIDTPSVHRFYSAIIKNVRIGPSPIWIIERLKDYGIESINNIVDITNYVMIESGMPLHAFDLNDMKGRELVLRNAIDGEKVETFDSTILSLTNQDIVFGSQDGSILGVAGIIGGKNSGIKNDTKDVLIECAAYDRVNIRKSMYRHNAQTEAGLRHSHDLHPSLCDFALQRAVALILDLAATGERKIDGVENYYPNQDSKKIIIFDPKETLRLGGINIDVTEQADILRRLEFEVTLKDELLEVVVPLFRTDIIQSADLVEEVLRIYGYDNIPGTRLASEIPAPITPKEILLEEKSKDILSSLGLNEIITVPFTTKEQIEKTKDVLIDLAISVVNPAASDYTHLRTNMYNGLIEATRKLLERGDESVKFFEIGKIYLRKNAPIVQFPHKAEFPYVEYRKIAGIVASKNDSYDFYYLKGIIETYLNEIEITDITFTKEIIAGYLVYAGINVKNIEIGSIGILDKSINKNFDIKQKLYVFNLDIESLLNCPKTSKTFIQFSEFPALKQDISVIVEKQIEAGKIKDLIYKYGAPLVHQVEIGDVFEMDNKKSLLFKITYQLIDRTLSTNEVNVTHLKIEEQIVKTFNAHIRGRQENQIIVSEIISIKPHPNADRLVICEVSIGERIVQIVTGASNMKVGDKVPTALPGTKIPGLKDENGDNIIMKVAKLRGIESYGMLLAADELGIGDDHEGLYILPSSKVAGEKL